MIEFYCLWTSWTLLQDQTCVIMRLLSTVWRIWSSHSNSDKGKWQLIYIEKRNRCLVGTVILKVWIDMNMLWCTSRPEVIYCLCILVDQREIFYSRLFIITITKAFEVCQSVEYITMIYVCVLHICSLNSPYQGAKDQKWKCGGILISIRYYWSYRNFQLSIFFYWFTFTIILMNLEQFWK